VLDPNCNICGGTGEVEVECSCHGMSPQYQCSKCGNGGVVVETCECSEEDEPEWDHKKDW